MKIALVIPHLHKQGGTERCMVSLGEALAARGHRIALIAARKSRGLLPEAAWYRVPIVPRPHVLRFASFLLANTLVRAWLRWVRSERFDVVHSTGPDVLGPTVATLHCCGAELANRLWREPTSDWKRWRRLRRLTNVLAYHVIARGERYVLHRGARRVIAVSRTLVGELGHYHGVDGDRLVVVPDGVDVREFHPGTRAAGRELRRQLSIPPDAFVVLFVGHNWERKGLGTLASALALIRRRRAAGVCLVVVGEGGRAEYAQTIRRTLDGAVDFLGLRSDMGPIYGMADVCVLPSAHESFGLPILEAMACGLAVVVSESAGVAEIIRDGLDGLLLKDPRDAEEVAAKLDAVLADADLRRRLGEHAARTAERYAWDVVAARVEAVYRSALAE